MVYVFTGSCGNGTGMESVERDRTGLVFISIPVSLSIRRPCNMRASPPPDRLRRRSFCQSVISHSPSPKLHGRAYWAMCATLLWRIHTMRRRFGDRSAGGSVPSPSQLERARTRFSTKIGSITSFYIKCNTYFLHWQSEWREVLISALRRHSQPVYSRPTPDHCYSLVLVLTAAELQMNKGS